MYQLASTGGKGGTGKSTFAVLLALKISKEKKVVLCDCDVECPNDYLLLNEKLRRYDPIYQSFPHLNVEKCVSCGICSKICKENAIFWIKGKEPIIFEDLCSGCGACWIVCPEKAIEKKQKVVGKTFINKINERLWLITGMSEATVSETGPIVKETKKRAIRLAKGINADVIIIDTAPGTHCNVIHALLGCEKAYIITEPTPLGAHDAELILQLLKLMNLPSEIVLNKADVGDKRTIETIAKEYNVDVTIEIPYSERLLRAYSRGQLSEVIDLLEIGNRFR